jgi:hypothetical protein
MQLAHNQLKEQQRGLLILREIALYPPRKATNAGTNTADRPDVTAFEALMVGS